MASHQAVCRAVLHPETAYMTVFYMLATNTNLHGAGTNMAGHGQRAAWTCVGLQLGALCVSCVRVCVCMLGMRRYVNGADPNRRRLSYKGTAEGAAMPLKHWHLLEGGWLTGWLAAPDWAAPVIPPALTDS